MVRLSKSGLGMALGLSLLSATPEVAEQAYARGPMPVNMNAHHIIRNSAMLYAAKRSQNISTNDCPALVDVERNSNIGACYITFVAVLATLMGLGWYLVKDEKS